MCEPYQPQWVIDRQTWDCIESIDFWHANITKILIAITRVLNLRLLLLDWLHNECL
jgi:hypothetical protein